MSTTHRQSTIHRKTMDTFLGLTPHLSLISLKWTDLSRLLYLVLCFSQNSIIYHYYNMKLQWSWTIHHVQNQPNLCLVNLTKAHINTYLTLWISFKGFHSRLLKIWTQNISGSNLLDSLYIILYPRYTTIYPYSIVHLNWPKSVDNIYLRHISAPYINTVLAIMTNILVVLSAASFWCEAPDPLNQIFSASSTAPPWNMMYWRLHFQYCNITW